MADGYGRSAQASVSVAATSGGGCLNTVPGLDEAFASRVPVLALIGGDRGRANRWTGSFVAVQGHSASEVGPNGVRLVGPIADPRRRMAHLWPILG
jgi:thiamine pyrophosphate-dependent acetolactate synthase large subunit-like protein